MKNLMKIPLLLFCMLLGIGQAWGATETPGASGSSSTDLVGTSFTIKGTYVAGVGGSYKSPMTCKGVKFRTSRYSDNNSSTGTANTIEFLVNAGYKITKIDLCGITNTDSKAATIGSLSVDGTAVAFTPVVLAARNASAATTFSTGTIDARTKIDFTFSDLNGTTQANIEFTVTYEAISGGGDPDPDPVVSNIFYANLKGADNSANPDTYTEGTGIESFAGLSNVEGFHFTGWSPSSISTSATGDQTITAQWEEIEPEGLIKLVNGTELNTEKFHTTMTLSSANYVVDGKTYTKYLKFGGTFTTPKGLKEPNKFIRFDMSKKTATVKAYAYNKGSSVYKFYIAVVEEDDTEGEIEVKSIDVPANSGAVLSADFTVAKNASIYFWTGNNSNLFLCQATVLESGEALPVPCKPGYSLNMVNPRFSLDVNSAKEGLFDGIEMNSNASITVLNAASVDLYTDKTNYIKFTLTETTKVKFTATFESGAAISLNNSKAYNAEENKFTQQGSVELEAGTWYINPNGKKTHIKKLEFLTPTPKYEVSFETNGGSAVASQSVKEGEKAAKPADPTKTDEDFVNWYEESTFETIFDFENKTITGPTTIYAKFVPHVTSSDATLSSLTVNGENILSGDEVEYTIYVDALPVVEAIKNNAYATVTPTEATAIPGTSTYVVEAEDHTLKTYTVNFKSYADACGTLMSAVLTSNTAATVTGIFPGAVDLKLSTEKKEGGYKLGGNDQYFGLVPTSGSFKKGDVVVIDVTAVSAKLEIFSDKGTTLVASADVVVAGENELVLTADADALYLYRTSSNMNPFVKGISVIRDCKPQILDFVIGDVHATIDHEAETITAELPYGTSLTAITPVVTLGYNVLSCTPEGAQDFSSAVNYVLTGANGTRTYVVTLTVESHDPAMSLSATEGQMAITGKNRTKTIKTTLNAKYMAGTTISAVLPEVDGLFINPTSFVVEGENAEKEFTITYKAANDADFAAMPAVINFRAEGMTDLAYTLNLSAEAWNEIALKSINGDMVFNFVGAVDSEIKGDNDGTYMALVNYPGVKAQANAEYVSVDFNKMPAGHLQGKGLKFHTTVPGFFTIECSNTGSQTYDRELYINGVATGIKSKTTGHVTYTQFAEAGDFVVTIKDENPQYEWNMFNFYKVTFTAASVVRAGVEAGRMYTYCPLEGVDKNFFSGAEFYVPENFDGSYVNLIKVDELTAGYGYIMVPTASTVYAAFDGVEAENGVAVEASAATHGMQGHLGAQVAIESSHDNVVIVSNHLYYAKNNVIDNGRAYIRLDIVKELEAEPENLAPRRRVGFAANGATDLVEIFEAENVQKVLIDGAIYIIREGQMFTVTGQLVK